jgi:hypothetical protein
MEEEPSIEACLRVVAPRLQAVLKRHHANYDFEELCEEILNYVPDFNPAIFKGIPTETIVGNTKEFFEYKKTTFIEMRKEFLSFLKLYWANFIGEDPEEIVINMKAKLQEWNDGHPEMTFPMINWVPDFGGIVNEGTPFPGYAQLSYMQERNMNFYVSGDPVSFNRK